MEFLYNLFLSVVCIYAASDLDPAQQNELQQWCPDFVVRGQVISCLIEDPEFNSEDGVVDSDSVKVVEEGEADGGARRRMLEGIGAIGSYLIPQVPRRRMWTMNNGNLETVMHLILGSYDNPNEVRDNAMGILKQYFGTDWDFMTVAYDDVSGWDKHAMMSYTGSWLTKVMVRRYEDMNFVVMASKESRPACSYYKNHPTRWELQANFALAGAPDKSRAYDIASKMRAQLRSAEVDGHIKQYSMLVIRYGNGSRGKFSCLSGKCHWANVCQSGHCSSVIGHVICY